MKITLILVSLLTSLTVFAQTQEWNCSVKSSWSREVSGALKLIRNTDGTYRVLYTRVKTGGTDQLLFSYKDLELTSSIQCQFVKDNALIFRCGNYSTFEFLSISSKLVEETLLTVSGDPEKDKLASTSKYLTISFETNLKSKEILEIKKHSANSFSVSDYSKCGLN